jgi:MFS family permease
MPDPSGSPLARLRARLFPNPGYYGWVIVGTCFLCTALTSPGQSFVLALYIDALIVELEMSRVGISTLYAVCTLTAALFLPVVGTWADRLGGRQYLGGVLVLLAGAMLLLASVRSVAMLAAAFMALRLLGQGAVSLGTLTTTVRWFARYRGRALAMVTLGFAAGELAFPGVVYGLTEAVGWRGSLVVLAIAYLVLFAPVVVLLIRDRRSDEPLDGGDPPERERGWPDPALDLGFTRREALAMPVFWGILACVAVPPLVMTAVLFHQVGIFASQGWDASLVPVAFAAFALGGIAGTYATGLLLEGMPTRFGVPLAMAFVIAAFGSLALPLPPGVGAILYGGLLGLGAGSTGATNELIWPDYFGVRAVGSLKGVVNAVRNGATAAGPPLAALLVTPARAFTPTFWFFGAMAGVAGIAAVAFRPPRETRPEPSPVD